MKSEFLDTGEIVNTHGIAGEVKLLPWSDTPEALLEYAVFYVGGRALEVASARVHKGCVLVKFRGVDDVDAAMGLKGKRVQVARRDIRLEPGRFLLADLIGLSVEDEEGRPVGTLREVLSPSAQNLYVVEGPGGTHMIPAVPEFVKQVDLEGGRVVVRLIEGM